MNKKRFLSSAVSLALCTGMVFSMSACKKNADAQQTTTPAVSTVADKDYKGLSADELLKKCIKDQKKITLEEYVSLLSTLSYAKISDKLELENNQTSQALNMLSMTGAKVPDSKKVIDALIGNKSPQVRGFAVGLMNSEKGLSKEDLETLKKLIKSEKEPYVLKCMIDTIAYSGSKDADTGAFLVKMSKDKNAAVRYHAALALGSKSAAGANGAVDAVIALMSDADPDVRKAAYKSCGALNDEKVIDPVVKMLSDEKSADYHAYGIMGLCTMWYDYPDHKNTSKAAYDATLNYFRTVKHSENTPSKASIGAFAKINSKTFDEWKKKATYFDVKEICAVMTELVKSADLTWDSRTAAMSVIAIHGTKADFEALGKVVDSLKDDQAPFVKGEYEKILKSL